jgi:hypothetical protein
MYRTTDINGFKAAPQGLVMCVVCRLQALVETVLESFGKLRIGALVLHSKKTR